MHKDLEHLRLLSIFHYIVGGLILAAASFFLIYFGLGLMMLLAPSSMAGPAPPPPPALGWIFTLLGGGAVFLGWAIGIGVMLAGRFLSRRTHYVYCLVLAGIVLLFQPFGTILGVFTLIVLLRPSVKHLFETGELPYDPEEDDEPESAFKDRIRGRSYNIHGER